MRRLTAIAAAVALGSLASCSNLPDQDTIDACYLTIGVELPSQATRDLGSINGWQIAAHKAVNDSRSDDLRAIAQRVLDTTSPATAQGGFTDPEIAAYEAAARDFERFCKESNAFEGEPRT